MFLSHTMSYNYYNYSLIQTSFSHFYPILYWSAHTEKKVGSVDTMGTFFNGLQNVPFAFIKYTHWTSRWVKQAHHLSQLDTNVNPPIIWMKIYNKIIFWLNSNKKIIFWCNQNHILMQSKSYFDAIKIIFWSNQNHILMQSKSYFDAIKIIFWCNQNHILMQSKSYFDAINLGADDVQLLFSGKPNNLEQLKIYAETSVKQWKNGDSENGLKTNSNKTQCIFFFNTKFQ